MSSFVLVELKALLDTLGTLGTIKIGNMPESPDAVGILYEYGGLSPDGQFGVAGIKYEKPSVQLVFRGIPNDYVGPRNKSEIAWRFLASVQPGPLGAGINTPYLRIWPIQSPFDLNPMDANLRTLIACNFYVHKELSL